MVAHLVWEAEELQIKYQANITNISWGNGLSPSYRVGCFGGKPSVFSVSAPFEQQFSFYAYAMVADPEPLDFYYLGYSYTSVSVNAFGYVVNYGNANPNNGVNEKNFKNVSLLVRYINPKIYSYKDKYSNVLLYILTADLASFDLNFDLNELDFYYERENIFYHSHARNGFESPLGVPAIGMAWANYKSKEPESNARATATVNATVGYRYKQNGEWILLPIEYNYDNSPPGNFVPDIEGTNTWNTTFNAETDLTNIGVYYSGYTSFVSVAPIPNVVRRYIDLSGSEKYTALWYRGGVSEVIKHTIKRSFGIGNPEEWCYTVYQKKPVFLDLVDKNSNLIYSEIFSRNIYSFYYYNIVNYMAGVESDFSSSSYLGVKGHIYNPNFYFRSCAYDLDTNIVSLGNLHYSFLDMVYSFASQDNVWWSHIGWYLLCYLSYPLQHSHWNFIYFMYDFWRIGRDTNNQKGQVDSDDYWYQIRQQYIEHPALPNNKRLKIRSDIYDGFFNASPFASIAYINSMNTQDTVDEYFYNVRPTQINYLTSYTGFQDYIYHEEEYPSNKQIRNQNQYINLQNCSLIFESNSIVIRPTGTAISFEINLLMPYNLYASLADSIALGFQNSNNISSVTIEMYNIMDEKVKEFSNTGNLDEGQYGDSYYAGSYAGDYDVNAITDRGAYVEVGWDTNAEGISSIVFNNPFSAHNFQLSFAYQIKKVKVILQLTNTNDIIMQYPTLHIKEPNAPSWIVPLSGYYYAYTAEEGAGFLLNTIQYYDRETAQESIRLNKFHEPTDYVNTFKFLKALNNENVDITNLYFRQEEKLERFGCGDEIPISIFDCEEDILENRLKNMLKDIYCIFDFTQNKPKNKIGVFIINCLQLPSLICFPTLDEDGCCTRYLLGKSKRYIVSKEHRVALEYAEYDTNNNEISAEIVSESVGTTENPKIVSGWHLEKYEDIVENSESLYFLDTQQEIRDKRYYLKVMLDEPLRIARTTPFHSYYVIYPFTKEEPPFEMEGVYDVQSRDSYGGFYVCKKSLNEHYLYLYLIHNYDIVMERLFVSSTPIKVPVYEGVPYKSKGFFIVDNEFLVLHTSGILHKRLDDYSNLSVCSNGKHYVATGIKNDRYYLLVLNQNKDVIAERLITDVSDVEGLFIKVIPLPEDGFLFAYSNGQNTNVVKGKIVIDEIQITEQKTINNLRFPYPYRNPFGMVYITGYYDNQLKIVFENENMVSFFDIPDILEFYHPIGYNDHLYIFVNTSKGLRIYDMYNFGMLKRVY